jgi:glyoxylase-like metal-dependent hydrolase (beta-lactamase superfamily II)
VSYTTQGLEQISPNLFRQRDIANTYLIKTGRTATCVDFGNGTILSGLADLGIDAVTDVVMTHHHRDVAQGLHQAVSAGARIWVPPVERDLFAGVDQYWQDRPLDNYYDVRDDRFSLFDSVEIAGTVQEYGWRRYGDVEMLAVPTPGHTPGSVTYVADVDGGRVAFTGDLIAAPGKVHSLASTQWAYNGWNGIVATILSGLDVLDLDPTVVLPAHGERIEDPKAAIRLLNARLQALINTRMPEWQVAELRSDPFVEITPHLLWNATGLSNSYALLSDDGVALLIDYGYDFGPYLPPFEQMITTHRSSRRPWLETIPALKRVHGIDRVEVVLPSHYHDDHVAGFNLLREVEGTQVWSPQNMTRIFQEPLRFDLPCIWYDPIGVDRELAFGEPVRWREYEITSHELPGHTLYAAAYEVHVDGRRVLATGDQEDFGYSSDRQSEFRGYNYKSRFRLDDYIQSGELYRRLAPDLIISGHWPPQSVDADVLNHNLETGRELAALLRSLLPLDDVDFGAEGVGARIEPYRSEIAASEDLAIEVSVLNPFGSGEDAVVRIVTPSGWTATPPSRTVQLLPNATQIMDFSIRPAATPVRRARIGADLTVSGIPFGIQAEALVTVTASGNGHGSVFADLPGTRPEGAADSRRTTS